MDKEQAELYVNSVNETKTDPQTIFLAMNLVFFAVAVALHHTLIFGIIVGCFAVTSILILIISSKKSSYFKTTVLIAMQLFLTCVSLNFIVFAIYQFTDKFVLWEYLVSVGIQIIVSLLSLIFFKIHSEKYKGSEDVKTKIIETVSGSVASLTSALALVLCRIFSPSFSAVLSSIAIFVNIASCLFGVCVVGVLYRAYLMKKYNITKYTKINKQPTQIEQ